MYLKLFQPAVAFIVKTCSMVLLGLSCCTGGTEGNHPEVPVADSIGWLLDKSMSLPDSMTHTAMEYAEKALQISRRKNPGKTVMFNLYYHLGVLSEQTGNYNLATAYFKEALAFSGKEQLRKTGNVFNYLGQMAFQQGKYDVAMEYFPKALNIRIQLNDAEGQATSYLNIGTAYQKEGYYGQAQEQYERSLNLYSMLNHETGKADCLNNLGGLRLEQNRPKEALEYYFETEKIYRNNNNYEQLRRIYNNIGNTYQSMGDTEQARKYYFMTLKLSNSLSSPVALAEINYTIGNFLNEINQPDSAISFYGNAIEIAESSGLYEVLSDALEERSLLFAKSKRYQEAYNDHVASSYIYNILNNKEQTRAFTQKSMQYQFDIQNQQQMFRNRLQRTFIIALSVVVFLVGALGLLYYRSYVRKKKDSELLAKQKTEITDSIRYASLIQKATFPVKEFADIVLSDYFIYFKPRDILSGDFYWVYYTDDYIVVAVADCTGHGVPGAMTSMLGISALNKITSRMHIPKASKILDELRLEIVSVLNPVGYDDRRCDGMDIALAVIHTQKREIDFAGAYNPLYLIRNGQLFEKKADKMPIGLYVKNNTLFTSNRFDYVPGDIIYMFTDGYADQFGGAKNSKFKTKNFKQLLLDISKQPMEEQERILGKTHLEWKGSNAQLDDILVVGVKLT